MSYKMETFEERKVRYIEKIKNLTMMSDILARTPFGAIALTEGTKTVLPKSPQEKYLVDGKVVSEWKLVLVSTTKDTIIGDADYFMALKNIEKYALDSKEDSILVKGLSLSELECLRG